MMDEKSSDIPLYICLFLFCSLLKGLLIPAYSSSDFEVHRNWLAITHNLPPNQWYFAGNDHLELNLSKSQWTLDYPPLFAWFEKLLAFIAYHTSDANMLDLALLDYKSYNTLLFQRISVICCDVVLFLGVYMYTQTWPLITTSEIQWSRNKASVVIALAVLNPSLFLVDNIHFQYNGLLLGVLLISISFMRKGTDVGDLAGGFTFAILLMLKHIFLYVAPLYFVYLLRHFCWAAPSRGSIMSIFTVIRTQSSSPYDTVPCNSPQRRSSSSSSTSTSSSSPIDYQSGGRKFSWQRFVLLSCIVGPVFLLSFASVIAGHDDPIHSAIPQILKRLFPVQRGLMHAYWAPNFWAVYALLDKVSSIVLRIMFPAFEQDLDTNAAMTGGVLGTGKFVIFPQVSPMITAIVTFITMIPALQRVWAQPHPRAFLPAMIYCMTCSFLFGYHVHEKAILMIVIPLTLACCDSANDARLYLLLSWIAHVSLSPLLFTPDIAILKPIMFFLHTLGSFLALDHYHLLSKRARRIRANHGGFSFRSFDKYYLAGLLVVYSISEIYPWVKNVLPSEADSQDFLPLKLYHRFKFLPLMLNSTYCALGVLNCWRITWIQLIRKQNVIETYQPSPRLNNIRGSDVTSNLDTFTFHAQSQAPAPLTLGAVASMDSFHTVKEKAKTPIKSPRSFFD